MKKAKIAASAAVVGLLMAMVVVQPGIGSPGPVLEVGSLIFDSGVNNDARMTTRTGGNAITAIGTDQFFTMSLRVAQDCPPGFVSGRLEFEPDNNAGKAFYASGMESVCVSNEAGEESVNLRFLVMRDGTLNAPFEINGGTGIVQLAENALQADWVNRKVGICNTPDEVWGLDVNCSAIFRSPVRYNSTQEISSSNLTIATGTASVDATVSMMLATCQDNAGCGLTLNATSQGRRMILVNVGTRTIDMEGFVAGAGDTMELVFAASDWRELSRSDN